MKQGKKGEKKDKNREGDQIVLTSAHTILVRFIAELNRKRFFQAFRPLNFVNKNSKEKKTDIGSVA